MEIVAGIALTFFFLLPGFVGLIFWRQSRIDKRNDKINSNDQ